MQHPVAPACVPANPDTTILSARVNCIDLKDKVAVVVGGASGIGSATVERMLHSGAALSAWDRAPLSERRPTEAQQQVVVDVTDEASVVRAMDETLHRFARVDIIVNCAGIAGPRIALADCPVATWQEVIDVNLTGTFLCCSVAVRHMQPRGTGRIVNVASTAGKDGNAYSSHYSAAKAGVIAMTKSLAKELAETSIRVNCVTPGAVDTPLLQAMDCKRRTEAIAKIPMGRAAQPHEIASMIAWLSSEECSFSTGAVFDASGGRATY
jgi:3-oxoacyl-[acyl-carrier protein] reductase